MSRSTAIRSFERCGAARVRKPFSRAYYGPLLSLPYRLGLFVQRMQERADLRGDQCLTLTVDDEERLESLFFARDDRLATRAGLCAVGMPTHRQPDVARRLDVMKAGSR